jgi:acetyl-CoA carboxylase biotin carboxyl carrier protein
MSESPSEPPRSPEVETIRQLVRLMQKYDLTAIDLGEGAHKIRLRRRDSSVPMVPAPSYSAPPPAQLPPPAAPAAPTATKAVEAPLGKAIESPMVGTFYASPAPDAPPFVSVGSVVTDKTIVCVIEAMKVFTEIPAAASGKITEILVKSGSPVEFGQPMFRISQE